MEHIWALMEHSYTLWRLAASHACYRMFSQRMPQRVPASTRMMDAKQGWYAQTCPFNILPDWQWPEVWAEMIKTVAGGISYIFKHVCVCVCMYEHYMTCSIDGMLTIWLDHNFVRCLCLYYNSLYHSCIISILISLIIYQSIIYSSVTYWSTIFNPSVCHISILSCITYHTSTHVSFNHPFIYLCICTSVIYKSI